MTSSHHAPYVLGYTRTTMGSNRGLQSREAEQIPKTSSQFGSEAATRLREAGIASNRGSACRGEYVPGPCTHRPSRHESLLYQKTVSYPARGAAGYGMVDDWGEVVTR